MPLRDHFRPPVNERRSWRGLHGGWPMMIVQHLIKILPKPYFAEPSVQIGTLYEVDVGTFDESASQPKDFGSGNGGVAVATYAPPRPTLILKPAFPSNDIFEVSVYDNDNNRRLIAAIEIVSPSNKDRPDSRATFISKTATLLKEDVCVSIVDLVTIKHFNLYTELLRFLECKDPAIGDEPPPIYATTLRMRNEGHSRMMDAWYHPLTVGEPLPTLPVWLNESWAVPLELEASYEETCRTLRMG